MIIIMDINLMQSELNGLRSKIDTSTEQFKFKKSIVGGYDPDQVEAYIKSLKNASVQEQKLFKEKYEEATSFSAMITQERDAVIKKLTDANTNLNEYIEAINELKNTNASLNQRIEEFTVQLGTAKTTDELEEKIKELEYENNEISSRLNEEIETKTFVESENVMLKDKAQDLSASVEKLDSENLELKDSIKKLKVSKRNIAVNTNTSIFEYQQKHKYNVERINNNISESLRVLEAMKAEMDDLYIQTQKNVSDEQQGRDF